MPTAFEGRGPTGAHSDLLMADMVDRHELSSGLQFAWKTDSGAKEQRKWRHVRSVHSGRKVSLMLEGYPRGQQNGAR